MNQISDELLMAYADNALDELQRRQVEAYLQTDPAAQQFVDDMVRSSELVRRAFDVPMHQPPPQRLLHTINGAPENNVVRFASRKHAVSRRWVSIAVAASLVVAAIAITTHLSGPPQQTESVAAIGTGPVPNPSPIFTALERTVSGEPVQFETSPGTHAVAMQTFRDGDNRPCRELELQQHTGVVIQTVIACRQSDAQWTVEGVFASTQAQPTSTQGYTPASGASDGQVDAMLNTLGASDPLPPALERQLIVNGWR